MKVWDNDICGLALIQEGFKMVGVLIQVLAGNLASKEVDHFPPAFYIANFYDELQRVLNGIMQDGKSGTQDSCRKEIFSILVVSVILSIMYFLEYGAMPGPGRGGQDSAHMLCERKELTLDKSEVNWR